MRGEVTPNIAALSEVVRGLWQGGVDALDEPEVGDFDVVVMTAAELQPTIRSVEASGGRLWAYPMLDVVPMRASDGAAAQRIGSRVCRVVERGGRVLVTCHAGLNRSGLVVALALVEGGFLPPHAVTLVRRARGPHALGNEDFERFVLRQGRRRGPGSPSPQLRA